MGHTATNHPHAVEIEFTDKIFERIPSIFRLALQDPATDLTKEAGTEEAVRML